MTRQKKDKAPPPSPEEQRAATWARAVEVRDRSGYQVIVQRWEGADQDSAAP